MDPPGGQIRPVLFTTHTLTSLPSCEHKGLPMEIEQGTEGGLKRLDRKD